MGTDKRARQKEGRQARIAAAEAAQKKASQRQRAITYGAVAALLVVGFVLIFVFRGKGSKSSASSTGTTIATTAAFTYGTTPCAPATVPNPPTLTFSSSFKSCIDPTHSYTATFDTTAGTVVATLNATQVPGTVNNFVELTGSGYYNNTKLFRTDPSIDIIQGGAPHTNSASDQGPGYTIPDEGSGYTYQAGQLVMARTSSPNSAGSQFFFVTGDKASSLNAQGTYVVFGNVTQGLDILQKVLATNVDSGNGLGGAPNPAVTVNSVTIKDNGPSAG